MSEVSRVSKHDLAILDHVELESTCGQPGGTRAVGVEEFYGGTYFARIRAAGSSLEVSVSVWTLVRQIELEERFGGLV